MPLTKLQFRPGIFKEPTPYTGEGGFYECNFVRFRNGFPEKVGGWENISHNYTYKGIARAMINWIDYNGNNLLGIGTSQKYYIEKGGQYYDITPLRTTVTLDTNPFATTVDLKKVIVRHVSHGAAVGTHVTFSGSATVGGLNLNNEFEIIEVVDSDSYVISALTTAGSTTTGGGASVSAAYQINSGNTTSVSISGEGWGANGWGVSPWGGAGTDTQITINYKYRVWSHTTHGQDLIMAINDGPIYTWDVDAVNFTRGELLSDHVLNYEKIQKTVASADDTGNTITVNVDGSAGIDVGAVVTAVGGATGLDAGLTYYVTVVNGNTITLSENRTGEATGTYSFTYSGRSVPTKTNYVFSSDIYKFVIALGANPYDPTDPDGTTFDPMLVRWADQDNAYEWTPSSTNQSGELILKNGSSLITAHSTRQEILIWSDSALYSMQYSGPPYYFGFTMLAGNISIASAYSHATVNNITYWMGIDKFYSYSGRVDTLPCSLWRHVFRDINKDQLNQIVCGTNEGFNEVWWFYPSADSTVNNRYIIYNHLEQVWYHGNLDRTAWLDSAIRDYPMAAFSVQNSYLTTDVGTTDTEIPLFNAGSYPAQGYVNIEGEVILYTGTTSSSLTGCIRGGGTGVASHLAYTPVTYKVPNQIMYHELGNDDRSEPDAAPIYSYLFTSDFDIGDGHNFSFINRILPDISFSGTDENTPNPFVTLMVQVRRDSGSAFTTTRNTTDIYATVLEAPVGGVEEYTGELFMRARGRQARLRLTCANLGVRWQLGAPRIDIRMDGRR